MTDPITPTGKRQHDDAWEGMDGVLGNHYTYREGCPACASLAAIEREAREQMWDEVKGKHIALFDPEQGDWCRDCDRRAREPTDDGAWFTVDTLDARRGELRGLISDAYYDCRSEGKTMEDAADRAIDAVLAAIIQAAKEASDTLLVEARKALSRHAEGSHRYFHEGPMVTCQFDMCREDRDLISRLPKEAERE